MRHALLLLLLVFTVGPAAGRTEPLRVFASVVSIRTFVEKIGGEQVDARVMVRPGYIPHTYDPTPQQIAALSEAVLYIRVGVPFEHAWMGRIRSANPAMQVLDVRSGIDLHRMEFHEHDDEGGGDARSPAGHDGHRDHHGHPAEHPGDAHHHESDPHVWTDPRLEVHEHDGEGGGDARSPAGHDGHRDHHGHLAEPPGDAHHHDFDPHVWTDPRLVKHMAGTIRDQLTALDPEHGAVYARRYRAFAAELDALDRDIRSLLDGLSKRKFMVFHPAWGYFARAYGLIQVPIEKDGKEPGPRALTALIEQAGREQVQVIFVQPQFSRKSAEQVARQIGGRVVAIDPLAADYADNLRRVARRIAGAAGR